MAETIAGRLLGGLVTLATKTTRLEVHWEHPTVEVPDGGMGVHREPIGAVRLWTVVAHVPYPADELAAVDSVLSDLGEVCGLADVKTDIRVQQDGFTPNRVNIIALTMTGRESLRPDEGPVTAADRVARWRRIEAEAREAVIVARLAGVHLGPLAHALDGGR